MHRPSLTQIDPSTRSGMLELLRELAEPEFARQERGADQRGDFFPIAWYSRTGAEMEAWSRILWGLAPALIGFRDEGKKAPSAWLAAAAERYLRRLARGCDPNDAGYWGKTGHRDQRYVEMAVLGVVLRLLPEWFADRLEPEERKRVAAWLAQILDHDLPPNNWHFFRVFVCLGLERLADAGAGVGAAERERWRQTMESDLVLLDSFYRGEGWYQDGQDGYFDYYNPFAFHFYGLLFGEMLPEHRLAGVFRERTCRFAGDYARMFDTGGRAVPFGRSLTYRFAQGSLFAACAVFGLYRENDDSLPEWFTLSLVKTQLVRHLRYWTGLPVFAGDGRLSVGYGYPSIHMTEEYNAHGSPGWAMKTFWALALPADHPFWQTPVETAANAPGDGVTPLPRARALLARTEGGGHVCWFNAGQCRGLMPRHAEDKYAKLVYSSRFGFAVSVAPVGLGNTALDSTVAVSLDGDYWRTRAHTEDRRVTDRHVVSRWRPWKDKEISVETWLVPDGPGHWRVHLIHADTAFLFCEGGFACPYDGEPSLPEDEEWVREPGLEILRKAGLASAGRLMATRGAVNEPATDAQRLAPQSHLLFAQARVPMVKAKPGPGAGLLVTAWHGGSVDGDGLSWLRSCRAEIRDAAAGRFAVCLTSNACGGFDLECG